MTVQVPADLIRGLVGIGGVVDLEDDQFGATVAVEIGDRDPRSLVFPGKPVRPHPLAPAAGNLPIGIQVPTDPVIAGVQTCGTVDLEDHQFGATVAVEIGDRNSCPLVLPGEPVGNGDPGAPSTRYLAGPIEAPADPVISSIRPLRAVDLKEDELRPPVAVQIGHRDIRPLILPGEPVRNGDPRTPSRGHLAGRVHRPAHAVVRLVHPGRIINLKDDELQLPVAVQICEGATRAVVLPGKPVWNGNEVGRHW